MNTAQLTAAALLALTAPLALATPASAHAFKVLHRFCQDQLCPDGFSPSALVSDGAGNFYGTTAGGGGSGSIFELKRRENGSYKFETLYGFCSQPNCLDGQGPAGPPVIDGAGNLYGTAVAGGASGYNGNVWKWNRSSGKVEVLHSFCVNEDCSDGTEPNTGLTYAGAGTGALYDGKAPLYGLSPFGGGSASQGTFFQLTPHRRGWKFQVLYSFCPHRICSTGAVPDGPLLGDASGNFYGVTYGGGTSSRGAVYEFSPSSGGWNARALYNFCQQSNCADGQQPAGTLALDSSGNLFGTTEAGGNSCPNSNVGCGVAFRLAPDGQETVLHTFCSQANCADGAVPYGAPYILATGDLIGTAQFGGNASSNGVVWRLSGGDFTTPHTFCKKADCADGAGPAAAFIPDGSGHLLGTTLFGGPNFAGVIYQITP